MFVSEGAELMFEPRDQPRTPGSASTTHIEAILISAAEPPHNRQGGRFGKEVEQYLQYRDQEALGPDTEAMLKELWKKGQTRRAT